MITTDSSNTAPAAAAAIISKLKEEVFKAWSADDGQRTEEDIASAVASKAVAEGALLLENSGLAALILAEYLRQNQAFADDGKSAEDRLRYEAVQAARREWQAITDAASRAIVVHDEDGGTSVEMRLPSGWSHEGCTTVGQWLERKVPAEAAVRRAAEDAAGEEARQFVAAATSMPVEQVRAAYWRLSWAAQNHAEMRKLPKAVRRILC